MFGSRAAGEVSAEASEAAAFLDEQSRASMDDREMKRVFSPTYSLPQATAALYGLQLADGVDPLQPAGYAERLTEAAGVAQEGYSVTLPSLEGIDPHQANLDAQPDPHALAALNIGYVVAHYDLEAEGLEPASRFGEVRVYRVMEVRPRAWLERGNVEAAGTVESLEWQPGWMRVTVVGPGQLHILETALPGWRATRDGATLALDDENGHLVVQLAEGEQEILVRYWPPGLVIGLALGLFGWTATGFVYWRRRRRGDVGV